MQLMNFQLQNTKTIIPDAEDDVEALSQFEHALEMGITKQLTHHFQKCLVLQQ